MLAWVEQTMNICVKPLNAVTKNRYRNFFRSSKNSLTFIPRALGFCDNAIRPFFILQKLSCQREFLREREREGKGEFIHDVICKKERKVFSTLFSLFCFSLSSTHFCKYMLVDNKHCHRRSFQNSRIDMHLQLHAHRVSTPHRQEERPMRSIFLLSFFGRLFGKGKGSFTRTSSFVGIFMATWDSDKYLVFSTIVRGDFNASQ
mmetsp:Transcript_26579/g.45368  ORF Transcript_26579/g.45368 Transcript_26579/m.45368 type:complete len:203 (+) Transcript_26579:168-776(+)